MTDRIRGLEEKISSVEIVVEKIYLLNELAHELSKSDPHLGLVRAEQAFNLTSVLDSEDSEYPNVLARSFLALGKINYQLGNYSIALPQALKSVRQIEIVGDKKLLLKSFLLLGSIHSALGNSPETLSYAHQALILSSELNLWEEGAHALGLLENTHHHLMEHGQDMDAYQSALESIHSAERKDVEAKLSQSEERFQLLSKASFEGIVISDRGQVVDANDQLAMMFGYERDEMIGIHAKEMVAPESWPLVRKNIEIGFDQPYKHIGLRKNGSTFPVEVRGRTIPYAGKALRVTVIRDITDREKAQAELLASEDRNRNLIENLPIPMIIHADEEILFVNPGAVQVFGLESTEDFVGRSVWDYVPPDLTETFAKRFDTLYRKRIPIFFEETRVLNAEGDELNVEIITNPVEYVGRPAAQSIILDISERKRAEEAQRQSEIRYRTLFENATDPIFLLRNGLCVDCNPSAVEIIGEPRSKIIGMSPFDISPGQQPDGRNSREKGEEFLDLAMNGVPQQFEWVHKLQDDSLINVEVKMNRVEIEDEILLLTIWRDLTERKRAEETALEERQRLARDLHDAVSQTLWSSTLIAEVLPELWEQDIEKGRDRLIRLRDLTRGAQAEMRALILELRPSALIETDLVELMRRLTEAIAIRTRAQIFLHVDGSCDLPPDVHVGLYRIAQEAINNAAHHAVADEIKCQLQCDPEYVKLEISDDGSGFDPSLIAPGDHLGLKIMRERSESIGAHMDIISTPDQGTSVSVYWSRRGGAE